MRLVDGTKLRKTLHERTIVDRPPTSDRTSFGFLIWEKRTDLGIGQRKASELTGISIATIA